MKRNAESRMDKVKREREGERQIENYVNFTFHVGIFRMSETIRIHHKNDKFIAQFALLLALLYTFQAGLLLFGACVCVFGVSFM